MLALNLKPSTRKLKNFFIVIFIVLLCVLLSLGALKEKKLLIEERGEGEAHFNASLVFLLSQLPQMISGGVVINQLLWEESKMTLWGRAQTFEEAAEFLENMKHLEKVVSVDLIAQREVNTAVEFEATVRLLSWFAPACAEVVGLDQLAQYSLRLIEERFFEATARSWVIVGDYRALVHFFSDLICDATLIFNRLYLSSIAHEIRAEIFVSTLSS
jgi:Fimbrial assembly protein (PilN)